MDVLERVIEADLEPLSKCELEGGYRAICTLMVFRTCAALGRRTQPRNDAVAEKRAAQQWLQGGVGLLTFEQVCASLDVDAERARRQIKVYADGMGRAPIHR
jgi:hypothetical protein